MQRGVKGVYRRQGKGVLYILSAEAVARYCPVMSNAISNTSSVCPRKVVMVSPEVTSQSLQVWSIEAVAITDPLKLNRALDISPL